MSGHAGALLLAFMTSWSAGVAGMLAGLAIYFLKKNDSAFVAEHAREAFNFNLTMFLLTCALVIIGVVLVGATVLLRGWRHRHAGGRTGAGAAGGVVAVSWLVCSVIATFKALNGATYRYPFTLRLTVTAANQA